VDVRESVLRLFFPQAVSARSRYGRMRLMAIGSPMRPIGRLDAFDDICSLLCSQGESK
jgi:hypothetical protein